MKGGDLKKVESGDLVWFPCEAERYQNRVGIFLGCHDNKADVDPRTTYRITPPRQVADILYKGKLMTCWAAHVRKAVS
jgi:hypothetical protein